MHDAWLLILRNQESHVTKSADIMYDPLLRELVIST